MTRLLNRADSLDFSNVINLRFEKSTFKSSIFKLNSDTEHHNNSVDGFLTENKTDNLSLHPSNLFKMKLNSTESPKLKQLSRSLNSLSRINNSFTVDK
uniref:Putative ovule protein n=1 Tax=Solanum chacoense TaxID=4108 RepID=A0A0V0H6U2_SOLCH